MTDPTTDPMTDPTIKPLKRERPLDALDLAILARLRSTPREASKAIAEALSSSETTVAARIRALENDNVIKVMAQRDFRAAGYPVLASVELCTGGRPIADIADELAGFERVVLVNILMGDPSLKLLVMAADLHDLHAFTMATLARIDGVRAVETFVFSEILKYRSELVAL